MTMQKNKQNTDSTIGTRRTKRVAVAKARGPMCMILQHETATTVDQFYQAMNTAAAEVIDPKTEWISGDKWYII